MRVKFHPFIRWQEIRHSAGRCKADVCSTSRQVQKTLKQILLHTVATLAVLACVKYTDKTCVSFLHILTNWDTLGILEQTNSVLQARSKCLISILHIHSQAWRSWSKIISQKCAPDQTKNHKQCYPRSREPFTNPSKCSGVWTLTFLIWTVEEGIVSYFVHRGTLAYFRSQIVLAFYCYVLISSSKHECALWPKRRRCGWLQGKVLHFWNCLSKSLGWVKKILLFVQWHVHVSTIIWLQIFSRMLHSLRLSHDSLRFTHSHVRINSTEKWKKDVPDMEVAGSKAVAAKISMTNIPSPSFTMGRKNGLCTLADSEASWNPSSMPRQGTWEHITAACAPAMCTVCKNVDTRILQLKLANNVGEPERLLYM